MNLRDPFAKGQEAKVALKADYHNPYGYGTPEYLQWQEGWTAEDVARKRQHDLEAEGNSALKLADTVWEHSLELLNRAETKKRDLTLQRRDGEKINEVELARQQGIADTLRGVLILMRRDDSFAHRTEEEWRDVRGTAESAHQIELHPLCPLDRSIMVHKMSDSRRSLFICTNPDVAHNWVNGGTLDE